MHKITQESNSIILPRCYSWVSFLIGMAKNNVQKTHTIVFLISKTTAWFFTVIGR